MSTISITADERKTLLDALSKTKNPALLRIKQKLLGKETSLRYAHGKQEINAILIKGFKERYNVKIKYYSLSSDETRYREVSIYKLGKGFIIAYCHLRDEERTFVTNRISAAALTSKKYNIPKGYKPESEVR